MRRRIRPDLQPRLTDMEGAAIYLGLGKNRATEIVKEAGAARRIGRRLLVDLRALDRVIDELPEA